MNVTIPTREDIRDVVDEALASFFTNHQPQQPKTEEFGGIDLAVEVTGYAKPTIYSKVSSGSIPHSKRGRKLFFNKTELLEWIESGKVKTNEEIEQDAQDYINNK